MQKTYHFMAGLPRSGSTLLSALLNQHPDIYASPQTDLLQIMHEVYEMIPRLEAHKAGLFKQAHKNILKSIPDIHYSEIDKPVIVDKNRAWGTPYNMEKIAPILNPDAKVIITLRPFLDVLASVIKVIEKSDKALGTKSLYNENSTIVQYRSQREAQIENAMLPNALFDMALFSIYNLIENYKDRILVVWFDDLMDHPQQTMNEIYNFLELESYTNNFDSIKPVDRHDDLLGYGVLGLHDVASKLQKPKTNPKDYLSDYTIGKYANTLDFIIEKLPIRN
jgi:sulfotransferase